MTEIHKITRNYNKRKSLIQMLKEKKKKKELELRDANELSERKTQTNYQRNSSSE